jgi:hypothetical protein
MNAFLRFQLLFLQRRAQSLQSEFDAYKAQIVLAGALDDPMLSVEMMNVPTDSFQLNEPET